MEKSAGGQPLSNKPVTYDPIKYVEKDVKVKSGLFSSKNVHVITLKNFEGKYFQIELDAKEYTPAKLQKFQQELFNRMSRNRQDFNSTILRNTIDTMIREEKMGHSPETIKVKALSKSFFSKMLQKMGLQKTTPLLPRAEQKKIEAEQTAREKEREEAASLKTTFKELQALTNSIFYDSRLPVEKQVTPEELVAMKARLVSGYDNAQARLKALDENHKHTSPESLRELHTLSDMFTEVIELFRQPSH